MIPWLKIKAIILLISCLAFTQQLNCPRNCSGYSYSQVPNYTGTHSACNTMTSCPDHINCWRCTNQLPNQHHKCILCKHEWIEPISSQCPRYQSGKDQHINQRCARPDSASAA
ncbi:hypothetical protein PGTUg99_005492 [Puccinia graminis f. sp. tritici]|uniref:TNFR-Cys domain-containing protein n=1 Tax=Puccinia graminis f. sp. tritici TaxID=56615 RepID=A0A5B0RIR3_PUCGR|nr:hypothetical protein PGTUg99_005492 [Puccinia graminis f. sp. tritici]